MHKEKHCTLCLPCLKGGGPSFAWWRDTVICENHMSVILRWNLHQPLALATGELSSACTRLRGRNINHFSLHEKFPCVFL